MALLETRYGCKVGWLTYDDEAEALAASEKAKVDAERLAARGYDFGYCVPGEIKHVPYDGSFHPGGDVWVVTIP